MLSSSLSYTENYAEGEGWGVRGEATSSSALVRGIDDDEGNRIRTLWRKIVWLLRCIWRTFRVATTVSPLPLMYGVGSLLDNEALLRWTWLYAQFSLTSLGPTAIKLGQWLSTRRDVLPKELCDKLSRLQSSCPTHSWVHTEAVLLRELGEGYQDTYGLNEGSKIVGSGCVGQVYFGVAKDGKKVAVKVLHPGVEEIVDCDLDIMEFFAGCIESMGRGWESVGIRNSVQEFSRVLKNQTNLNFEGDNIETFRGHFKNCDDVVFPNVVHKSQKVLVESFEDGRPIDEFFAEAEGVKRKLAKELVDVFLR